MHALIAYDADGNVVGTMDHMVARDADGNVVGLVDFEAHTESGGRLRDVWDVISAVGSATWPEWLAGAAHDFTVELDPNPGNARAKIAALVHKKSGHRRERVEIEAEIERRVSAKRAEGEKQRHEFRQRGMPDEMVTLVQDPPADLRDLLGGPGKPLLLDEHGRTRPRPAKSQRPALPVVRRAGQNRA